MTNTGSIDIASAAGGNTLTLNDTTISNAGGNITVAGAIAGPPAIPRSMLDLTGNVPIDNGVLDNLGQIDVSGLNNVIENEDGSAGTNIFTNTGALEVVSGGVLSLTNDFITGGTITVDAGANS